MSEAIIQIDRALGNYTEVEIEESVWVGKNATKVAKSPENLEIILSYPLAGLFEYIFVYVLTAKTSASQAGPEFKTVRQRVWKNNSRDLKKIWLL